MASCRAMPFQSRRLQLATCSRHTTDTSTPSSCSEPPLVERISRQRRQELTGPIPLLVDAGRGGASQTRHHRHAPVVMRVLACACWHKSLGMRPVGKPSLGMRPLGGSLLESLGGHGVLEHDVEGSCGSDPDDHDDGEDGGEVRGGDGEGSEGEDEDLLHEGAARLA